jgi:hypothetical protein
VEDFGIYEEPAKVMHGGQGKSSGVSFNGPVSVQNLAIAAGSALQKIKHLGTEAGASLQEIASLLPQSEELTPRQMKEGLAHIEAVAAEEEKPEDKRNWKSLVERGTAILELAGKATDVSQKLAPYTSAIKALVDKAKHYL